MYIYIYIHLIFGRSIFSICRLGNFFPTTIGLYHLFFSLFIHQQRTLRLARVSDCKRGRVPGRRFCQSPTTSTLPSLPNASFTTTNNNSNIGISTTTNRPFLLHFHRHRHHLHHYHYQLHRRWHRQEATIATTMETDQTTTNAHSVFSPADGFNLSGRTGAGRSGE